ncbi:hypothetical protein [Frankia sp. CiP1_Cm_nod2]|uniref:hypothetical protein n=1 Tax=Frankia sp. CiP1_Cm_nod2 TaxID=2897161 RepID=UPI002024C1A3
MADNRPDPRNAAALRALHSLLAQASHEAAAAQTMLQDSTARFQAVSEQVIAVVGGSAQQVDKQLAQSLREAAHHTGTAIAALGAAKSSARSVH